MVLHDNGIVFTSSSPNHHEDLERTFQAAVDMQQRREASSAEKDDHIQNENKNQGLINTIVNHNNKLKTIENMFNFIVNNFANSSHVKEVIEKTKELEKHVFGAPRPHRSWREFVLFSMCIGVVLYVAIKIVKKYCVPRFIGYIRDKSCESPTVISTLSEYVERRNNNDKYTVVDLKNLVEHQLKEQNEKLDFVSSKLNMGPPTTTNPTRD
jgi:hypothetical protein